MNLSNLLNAVLLLSPLSSYARSAETHLKAPSTAPFDSLSATDLSTRLPRGSSPLPSRSPFMPAATLPSKESELTGNLTISINIDKFAEIFAEELLLTDGVHPAIKHKITQPTLQLTEIPIGTYTLISPTGKDLKYAIDTPSAFIKPSDNEYLLNYRRKPAASLLMQSFTFLGDRDKPFAILNLDFENELLTLNIMEKNPNRSFDNKTGPYAFVLLGHTDTVVFLSAIPGTNATTGIDHVKFNYGDALEICHAEPNRLETKAHLLLTPELCNLFWIKQGGLLNEKSHSPGYENFKLSVDQTAQVVRANPEWKKMKYNSFKDNIWLALPLLEKMGYNRTDLLKEYQDVIPLDNQPPGEWVGNQFSINLEGIYDDTFSTIAVDAVEKEITFEVKPGQPHLYFNDTYARVSYRDSAGEIRYEYDFIGNEALPASKLVLPLSDQGGEQLSIFHQEGGHEGHGRCLFNNQMQNKTILCDQGDQQPGKAVNVTYQLTSTALSPITPKPLTTSTTRLPSTSTPQLPSTTTTVPTTLITSITALSSSRSTSAASPPMLPCAAGWLGVGTLLISSS